jgi:uncharacterized protein (DUF2237 family)
MDVTQKNGAHPQYQNSAISQLTQPVLNAPLHKHSSEATSPKNLPSHISAGMCSPSSPIAAILTNAFLDFSSSNGTDLRKSGVASGQRFCLSASTWKNAADKGIGEVPKVKLESTHKSALEKVDLGFLKKHAAEMENEVSAVLPGSGKESWARDSSDIGAKEPRS